MNACGRWARWFFLPTALLLVVVLLPCALALVKHQWLQSVHCFWHNADFWVPCTGSLLCGCLWVWTAHTVAPVRKLTVAAVSLLPGAWLAWVLVGEVPLRLGDGFTGPWFTTRTPVYLAWWAGLGTLALLAWRSRRKPVALRAPVTPGRARAVAGLACSILLCGGVTVPAGAQMYRWTLYRTALHAVVERDDSAALRTLERCARWPGFDPEWTPGRVLRFIPHGYALDDALFGCPSCRGIHSPLLEAAARHGCARTVAALLARRGGVAYGGDRGASLLLAAVQAGSPAVLDLLLEHGADASATNTLGSLMHMGGFMHLAAMTQDVPAAVLERLLRAGAPINRVSRSGLTPLDCAHIWNPGAIPYLRAHGATNAAVRQGLTPWREAERLYRFAGTPFGLRLPEGFAPWNRLQTPTNSLAWEVRNDANSSLRFRLGPPCRGEGTNGLMRGLPVLIAREERDWGHCWCAEVAVYFDSTAAQHATNPPPDAVPHYDAILGYKAFNRHDRIALERAIGTLFCIQDAP